MRSRHFETWFGTRLSSSGAGSRPRGTKFVENSNFLGLHASIHLTTILFRSVARTICHVLDIRAHKDAAALMYGNRIQEKQRRFADLGAAEEGDMPGGGGASG